MNRPITRLFVVVLVLFAGLAAATSWWTVVKADELNAGVNPAQNQRALLRDLKVRRGVIRDDAGKAIARSVRGKGGDYSRTYPQGALFGHPVGYSLAELNLGDAGLEAFRNGDLSGQENGIASLFDELTGKQREGRDVRTSLDPEAQRVAIEGIQKAGKSGSAVALDPRTGAVEVLKVFFGRRQGHVQRR